MKKILITGGTGFIGSALVKKLLKDGYTISVFDNDSRGKVNRLEGVKKDFEFISGDIRDAGAVIKACKKKDIIFHLAFINGTEFFYSKPELVLEVGVKGMTNVLDGCLKNNVPEIFLASSSEVYNQPSIIPTPENIPLIIPDLLNPRFSYGGAKIISELMVINYARKHFKRAIIFRPHNVYGPDMGTEHVISQFALKMKTLKEKKGNSFLFPIQGTGKETRAFIYIDDFINGLEILLKKGKHREIYNIGVQTETTIEELADKISTILHCQISIKTGNILPGSTTRRVGDITKISKLGFNPSYNLEQGLEKTVNWYFNTNN
jgi:nucleoside-diphosphate-sugar epimerase